MLKTFQKIAGIGLFVIPVTITFTDKVAAASQVIGVSMQPLLNPNFHKGKSDWLLQNKWAVSSKSNLQRGDVVTFITPYSPEQMAVKRIIALEGDLVRTKKDKNVSRLIPSGHVWVEGDNSAHSRDSNNYGPISMNLITSKVTYIIWPPSRWQKLNTVEIDSDRVIKRMVIDY